MWTASGLRRCVNFAGKTVQRCSNLYFPKDYEIEECRNHPNTRGIFQDGAFTSYTVVPANSVYHISPMYLVEQAALAKPLMCVKCARRLSGNQSGRCCRDIRCRADWVIVRSALQMSGATKIIVSEPKEYRGTRP